MKNIRRFTPSYVVTRKLALYGTALVGATILATGGQTITTNTGSEHSTAQATKQQLRLQPKTTTDATNARVRNQSISPSSSSTDVVTPITKSSTASNDATSTTVPADSTESAASTTSLTPASTVPSTTPINPVSPPVSKPVCLVCGQLTDQTASQNQSAHHMCPLYCAE